MKLDVAHVQKKRVHVTGLLFIKSIGVKLLKMKKQHLAKLNLDADLLTCNNVNCMQHCHKEAIDMMMLSNITSTLHSAGKFLHNEKKGNMHK